MFGWFPSTRKSYVPIWGRTAIFDDRSIQNSPNLFLLNSVFISRISRRQRFVAVFTTKAEIYCSFRSIRDRFRVIEFGPKDSGAETFVSCIARLLMSCWMVKTSICYDAKTKNLDVSYRCARNEYSDHFLEEMFVWTLNQTGDPLAMHLFRPLCDSLKNQLSRTYRFLVSGELSINTKCS